MSDVMDAVLLTGFGGFEKLQFRDGAGLEPMDAEDSAWSGQALEFPRIQGIDVCGEIVATGANVSGSRIGERVIVVPMQRSPVADQSHAAWTLGADGDGGFAQYVVTNSVEAFAIDSGCSDVELASFPCSWSTAENLIEHAAVSDGDTVLITGASGGVGSAAIQLARRRGASVIAVAGAAKHELLLTLGANQVVPRSEPLADHRTLQEPSIFAALVGYIEREEIKPVVSATYPLRDIVQAQKDFLTKQHVGKLVLLP